MVKGQNVNLFLLDGEVTGRIKCTLANWTGLVYKIPRSLLDESKDISALHQSAIYMLFGMDDNNEPLVYIGQAGIRKNDDGVLQRLKEHDIDSSKDFWTEAVILTTSNDSFGPTDLNFLENHYYKLIKAINRYKVFNENEPTLGNVTEEKVSELLAYIEFSKLPIGLLGKKVLTPIDELAESSRIDGDIIYTMTQKVGSEVITGYAKETNEGFLLLRGSKVSHKTAQTISESLKLRRKTAKKDNNNCILDDILFNSPSTAAMFLIGQTANGLLLWKNKDGVNLKEIRNRNNNF